MDMDMDMDMGVTTALSLHGVPPVGGVRLRWRSAEEAEEAEAEKEEGALLRSTRIASMAARSFLSHCDCCAAVSPRHASVAQRLGHS